METNSGITTCQVVQLAYACETMWKHARHLLEGFKKSEKHQGGLQRGATVGADS